MKKSISIFLLIFFLNFHTYASESSTRSSCTPEMQELIEHLREGAIWGGATLVWVLGLSYAVRSASGI